MYGCKTATPRTIYPLVVTRPAGMKLRTHHTENRAIERCASVPVVPEPLYTTEAAVTSALASGTLIGLSSVRYSEAIAYQKYLKKVRVN